MRPRKNESADALFRLSDPARGNHQPTRRGWHGPGGEHGRHLQDDAPIAGERCNLAPSVVGPELSAKRQLASNGVVDIRSRLKS
jgi:hypothetical protein